MSGYLILYILHHKACIAGAESTEIQAADEWSVYTVFIRIKAGLKYTQGLKYTLGSAAE